MSNPTLEEVRDHFRMLQGCCLHIGGSLSAEDIVAVHGKQGDDFGRSDASRATWVEFADGRHGGSDDSEDYTGHGCMCSSSLEYFDDSASARSRMASWPGNPLYAVVNKKIGTVERSRRYSTTVRLGEDLWTFDHSYIRELNGVQMMIECLC